MKNAKQYVTGVLLLIFAVILIIIGITFIKSTFRSDAPKQNDKQTQSSKKVDLLGAANNNQAVQYTVRGSVTGNESHRAIRIKVDRTSRTVEVLQGYNETVINSQRTDNTQEAYQAFIDGLQSAGFTRSISAEGRGDESLSCPLGNTYVYELDPGVKDAFRTWSNTCSTKQGTFAGNRSTIETLFKRQIPNYDTVVTNVQL